MRISDKAGRLVRLRSCKVLREGMPCLEAVRSPKVAIVSGGVANLFHLMMQNPEDLAGGGSGGGGGPPRRPHLSLQLLG